MPSTGAPFLQDCPMCAFLWRQKQRVKEEYREPSPHARQETNMLGLEVGATEIRSSSSIHRVGCHRSRLLYVVGGKKHQRVPVDHARNAPREHLGRGERLCLLQRVVTQPGAARGRLWWP